MDLSSIALILSGGSAVVGPVIAYVQGKKRSSGKVDSSEASDLWNEGKNIRDFLMTEINNLKDELKAVKKEFEEYKKESEEELDILRKANRELQNTINSYPPKQV